MLQDVLYLEKNIMERFGGSFNDVENTNYWDILDVMEAQNPNDKDNSNNNSKHNAYSFFKNRSIK